jgi:hypothetical protein
MSKYAAEVEETSKVTHTEQSSTEAEQCYVICDSRCLTYRNNVTEETVLLSHGKYKKLLLLLQE